MIQAEIIVTDESDKTNGINEIGVYPQIIHRSPFVTSLSAAIS